MRLTPHVEEISDCYALNNDHMTFIADQHITEWVTLRGCHHNVTKSLSALKLIDSPEDICAWIPVNDSEQVTEVEVHEIETCEAFPTTAVVKNFDLESQAQSVSWF